MLACRFITEIQWRIQGCHKCTAVKCWAVVVFSSWNRCVCARVFVSRDNFTGV